MKPIRNFENVQASGDFKKLPEGAYKLIVKGIKYQDNSAKNYSDQLIIQVDIAEGEHKDFFTEQYNANTSEDKKYKGIIRIYVPNDDGSEKDGWTASKFKAMTNAFEDSNPGYSWNWDENTLKGKVVGGVYNLKEYEYNGRHGFFTNFHHFVAVSDIDTAKIPEPTYLAENSNSSSNSSYDATSGTGDGLDEIPFN